MARQRPADHLPREVLDRPDFAQACAERDLGGVLRLAKKWGGVGYTASHLARRCELTVSRVQDYVNGSIQAQRIEVFERVADGLRIPGAMFDLAPRSWEDEAGCDRPSGPGSEAACPTEDGDDPVLRRDFVKLGAGVAASALTPGLAGIPSRTSGTRVGSSAVDALRANMARLRPLDDHLGGADTYPFYAAEVEKVDTLLKTGSYSGAIRLDLLRLFAEEAQQAGWAAFDADRHQDAEHLYERSFGAAREAGDTALIANAFALRSYQLLSTGTIRTDLSDKSIGIAARSVHPAVKSLLYQRAAWTYAVAGQSEQVSRALGHAEEALTATNGEPAPAWAAWAHNATELRIMAGRCWAELHKPLRAVPAMEAAMAEYDDSHARDKALYLSWLADAYLDADEIESATSATNHALDLAGNVGSARPSVRLGAVLDRFEQYRSASGVPDLLARRPVDPLQIRR